MLFMKKVSLFCLLLAFVTQACMDNENPDQAVNDLLEQQDVQITRHLEANNIDAQKDQLGAYVVPIVENPSGTVIEEGDVAEVTYNLTQLDGTSIGNNEGDSMRLAFDSQSHYAPIYLYAAMAHLKEGEKKRFYVPFDMAYRNLDLGGKVPYRSIVVMELEVKDVYKTAAELKEADIKMIERVAAARGQDVDTLASGVRKYVVEAGEGEETPDANDVASVYYTGRYLNGEQFDTNTGASGEKFDLTIGAGGVIPGFETAVKSMKPGEKALFYLPSGEAYGKGLIYAAPENIREELSKDQQFRNNAGAVKIPPHSPLVFEIELTDLTKKD